MVGDYAYVVGGTLEVVDVSSPISPTLMGNLDLLDRIRDIQVVDNYAYVTIYDRGLQVVDVSNLISPTLVGSLAIPGEAGEIQVVGGYAYVTSNDYDHGENRVSRVSTLHIVEVRDPTSPTLVGSYDTPDWVESVYVVGNYAYVTWLANHCVEGGAHRGGA